MYPAGASKGVGKGKCVGTGQGTDEPFCAPSMEPPEPDPWAELLTVAALKEQEESLEDRLPPPAAAPAAAAPAAAGHHQLSLCRPPAQPVQVPSEAAATAPIPSPRKKCYHVHLYREDCSALGFQLEHSSTAQGQNWNQLEVRSIKQTPGMGIHDWNLRCLSTFPPDAVQCGDVVVKVNDVRRDSEKMTEELHRFVKGDILEIFMEVHRCESSRGRSYWSTLASMP